MEKSKKKVLIKNDILKYFLPSFLLIFVLCALACALDQLLGITDYLFREEEDFRGLVTEFFLVEVQVAFIVVSLSTALSTQTKRVYWVDSFQYRLVKPKHTNFTALSSYILATLVVGILWEVLDRCISSLSGAAGILLSFILSLILMIILSMRMIGANFGRESIKRDLEEELRDCKAKQKITEHIGYDLGLRIPQIRELVQVTFQEIEEKQLDLVCENLDLLFRLGFRHELKRCYNYAEKSFDSKEIMEEIDFSLMRKAVLENKEHFFYMDCPLSMNALLKWWDELIDERFDDAVLLWRDGKKEEAMDIRKKLYLLLANSLVYHMRSCEIGPAGPEDDGQDGTRYRILSLMAKFVERRKNLMGVWNEDFEDIPLGKDWEVPESKGMDEEKLDSVEILRDFAKETLREFEKRDYIEDPDLYTLPEAAEF